MKRFYQMRLVIDLFERKQDDEMKGMRPRRLLETARIVLVTLLPLLASMVFEVKSSAILGSLVLIAFAAYVSLLHFCLFKTAGRQCSSLANGRLAGGSSPSDFATAFFFPSNKHSSISASARCKSLILMNFNYVYFRQNKLKNNPNW